MKIFRKLKTNKANRQAALKGKNRFLKEGGDSDAN